MPISGVSPYDPGAGTAVARTIPGLRRFSVPKKPVRSAATDESRRAVVDRPVPGNRRGLFGSVACFVLPSPVHANNRWRVIGNIALAYALVFFSLGIVHIPFVLHAAPTSISTACAIFWRDLVASHLGHWFLYGAMVTLLCYSEGLFDRGGDDGRTEHFAGVVKAVGWATVLLGGGLYLCRAPVEAPILAGLSSLMMANLIVAEMIRHMVQSHATTSGRRTKNVLIVGTTATAREVARQLASPHQQARRLKGFVSQLGNYEPGVLGTIDDLAQIARAEYVDEIIIASEGDRQLAERAVAEALRSHLDVSIVPDLFARWPNRLSMQSVGSVPLISVHEEPIPRAGLLLKRAMDVVISATTLAVLSPLLLLVAMAIKLESRGPFCYCGLRAGKKGRCFRCYKFRTMYADADRHKDELRCRNERRGPTFKIANDPRITPLGHVLRRYSLDELPQLWNVLTGTMSMVGPRPHPLDDYQAYGLEDKRRLDVLPGLTGLWQIKARTDPSFRTNMALDLEYIENWSLGMDFMILLKTIPAVLRGTGA